MSYSVKSIEVFERQAKKLIKKYPSLKIELLGLIQELKENPKQGVPLGKSCFKIRIAIKSKGKGKSGGASAFGTKFSSPFSDSFAHRLDKGLFVE